MASAPGREDAWRTFRQRKHFGSLDGLRALAILAVLWHHTPGHEGFAPIASAGFLGVDLFFVLSGFLIVTLLLREREKHGAISMKAFFMRRTFRIFPLYFASIGALTLRYGLVQRSHPEAQGFMADLPYLLTYTLNFAHSESRMAVAWSLAAEEQFYLVWSAMEAFLAPLAPWVCLAGIALNQLFVWRAIWPESHLHGLEMGQITFTPILRGVLLAHALHRPRFFAPLNAALAHRWMPPLLLVAILGLIAPFSDLTAVRPFLQLGMALLLASAVLMERHHLSWLFEHRLMVRVGVVSYGLYLLHPHFIGASQKVLRLVEGAGASAAVWVAFLVTWGTSMVAAELSFRFFETPFLRLKRRFER